MKCALSFRTSSETTRFTCEKKMCILGVYVYIGYKNCHFKLRSMATDNVILVICMAYFLRVEKWSKFLQNFY